MDRRSLLALAATLPALFSTPANACSYALKSPRAAGLENQQVQRLFEAWWQRDKERFRELFNMRLMADGSPMERDLANELARLDPLPVSTFEIFDVMFLDERKNRKVALLVNTDAGIFAACSEADYEVNIGADCSGTPNLHLFLIKMSGLNPRSVIHLSTVATPEPSKFSVWTGG
ncbi:hypothetical protein [Sphingomonas sp. HMP6]|uniref:hypothetical protein n=1 Tax=Sphingomonas sp. HMP6 TaxID=1517551 RepID=UPI001596ACE9|nr:hypothetical protein [Sphingomonas sp. HMP6]